ncbi:MAG TPA: hypothetical protein VFZ53_12990, partial [Polyangiaceae bacterium]
MSDENDHGSRPPRGPGSGASGTAGSIGKALGGDLDFEPDLLLDALTEEEARPTRRPPEPGDEPEPKLRPDQPTMVDPGELEGDRPSFAEEEVTIVGQRDFFESTLGKPGSPIIPPKPYEGTGSSAPTPLVQPPKGAPPSAARPAPPLRPPPTVPRPLGGSPSLGQKPQIPGIPRPGQTAGAGPAPPPAFSRKPSPPPTAPPPRSEMPTLSAATTAPPPTIPVLLPAPHAAKSAEESSPSPSSARAAPPPDVATSSTPPEGEARTSLTPEEITALEELDQLESLPPAPQKSAPPSGAASRAVYMSDRPRMSSLPPRASQPPPLAAPGQPDEWTTRAEWLETEARRIPDPQARSRALIVASELWAIAGDMERARRAAQDGNTAGRAAVAGRQLRSIAAASGDWKTVASTLEIELRGASTSEARAHAALLDAEVYRLCLGDDESAKNKIELAIGAKADDPRPHLEIVVAALKAFDEPALELPETPDLGALSRALEPIVAMRGDGAAGTDPLSAFGVARRAIARGDRAAAAAAIARIGGVEGLKDAAAWLSAALLAHDAGTREESAAELKGLIAGDDARAARRTLAARALELGD